MAQGSGGGDFPCCDLQRWVWPCGIGYQAAAGLSLSFGLRYDWQNYFHDTNNFAPRLSIAFAPGNRKTTVLRAGSHSGGSPGAVSSSADWRRTAELLRVRRLLPTLGPRVLELAGERASAVV